MTFTQRETAIITAVSYGLTNKQIGVCLHIGEATVRTYIARLLKKTGAVNRSELVRAGFENGILTNDPPPEWINK